MIRFALPPPTGDGSTMIFVCGTDGFVETWGGPVRRGSGGQLLDCTKKCQYVEFL